MSTQRKKWSEFTPKAKAAVVGGLAAHVVLVGLAHADMGKRSQDELRGPRWVWRLATAANSSFVVAYFLFGRNRSASH